MPDRDDLLTDEQVLSFITRGYHLVEPDFPEGFNEGVCEAIDHLKGSLGNGIYNAVPALKQVYEHPKVRGALVSLLGEDVTMNGHRHLHTSMPGSGSQSWHQDGTNVRHHQTWCCLAMYYPHDVAAEMGPTAIMPGTHFRNTPTDLMANYTNIKGTVFLTVKAGTVAITHYDLWHCATLNRTDRRRYMLKFLFDRKTAPTKPTWNHDPATADQTARGKYSEMVGHLGYGSDYYKEWELRKQMWLWMQGRNETVPAGAFKDMLS
jgi:hypothetical protein